MFSKECAVSLLQDARNLVKEMRHAPAADLSKALTLRKMSRINSDVYYHNLFKFCKYIFKSGKNNEFFIKEFNTMITVVEKCDILDNCRSFAGKDSKVMSNISLLNNYKGDNADLVLLASSAVSENFVVLQPADLKLLLFAKKNNISTYLVASMFNIDTHSLYSPALCFPPDLFKGVISENGLEPYSEFVNTSRTSFNWLFF